MHLFFVYQGDAFCRHNNFTIFGNHARAKSKSSDTPHSRSMRLPVAVIWPTRSDIHDQKYWILFGLAAKGGVERNANVNLWLNFGHGRICLHCILYRIRLLVYEAVGTKCTGWHGKACQGWKEPMAESWRFDRCVPMTWNFDLIVLLMTHCRLRWVMEYLFCGPQNISLNHHTIIFQALRPPHGFTALFHSSLNFTVPLGN